MCTLSPSVNVKKMLVANPCRNNGYRHWIDTIVLFLLTANALDAIRPQVETRFGTIQGKWTTTARGRAVANYLGIPYAKPPIDDLRFRSPQLWNYTWNVPYDASNDGTICLQQNTDGVKVIGDENCLFLNVYVPLISGRTDITRKLPVLVFIHGGAFNSGSSDSRKFSPYYLLDQNMILVTLNYRLNILGYLSTGNQVSPGNYGTKDILVALRWINENIDSFQGDPNSVTLYGQSAGAALTHQLALTKKTDQLFHRYIMQSAAGIGPWAVHSRRNIRKYSLEVAKILGCLPRRNESEKTLMENEQGTESTTKKDSVGESYSDRYGDDDYDEQEDEEIMNCMRSIDGREIVRTLNSFSIWRKNPYCIFGPTIEDESEDAILTMHPLKVIKNNLFRDIPRIVGVVQDEGLTKTIGFYTTPDAEDEMVENFEMYLLYLVEYHDVLLNKTHFARAIEDFYYSGNVTGKLLSNITEILGDAMIYWYTYQALNYQSEMMNSSTYFYIFSYEGTFSSTFSSGIPVHYGIAHTDDLNYIFPIWNNLYSDQFLHNNENDWTMIHIMCEMWSSFISEGVPKAWRIIEWPNYNEDREFLRIGVERLPDVVVETEFLPERMAFWEKLWTNVVVEGIDMDLVATSSAENNYDYASDTGITNHTNVLVCLLITFIFYFI